jgi:hypothetical protein
MSMIQSQSNPASTRQRIAKSMAAIAAGLLAAGTLPLQAQPITVPNFSFESPTAPNTYPYVNTSVASWQKNPEPSFYGPAFGGSGITWDQTAGVFLDVNPYANHDGSQVGYILSVPQVALFQDYTTSPTHDFNATFDVGKSYNLTVGVFAKPGMAPGATLDLSMYYLDASNNKVTVDSTTITYSSAAFPTTSPLNLIDYSVNVPTVQTNVAWAGQHIGIEIESTVSIAQTTFVNWDIDNVRLTAAPEPASLGLAALGFAGLLFGRARSRRSS